MAFQYEWWTIEMEDTCNGTLVYEFKGKSKDHVIKTIKTYVKKINAAAKNTDLPWWERGAEIYTIKWETLKLDRIGHQR